MPALKLKHDVGGLYKMPMLSWVPMENSIKWNDKSSNNNNSNSNNREVTSLEKQVSDGSRGRSASSAQSSARLLPSWTERCTAPDWASCSPNNAFFPLWLSSPAGLFLSGAILYSEKGSGKTHCCSVSMKHQ